MDMPAVSPSPSPARRSRGSTSRLTRDAWVDAALVAIAEGGLAAAAVEPVAARLGATKGSFYWHFANREELLVAALRMWEKRNTDDVITGLAVHPDPAVRLRTLFLHAFGGMTAGNVDAALLADATSPLVAPVLQRVTLRRMEYLVETYGALGLPPEQARSHAVLAYTAYLGLFSLRRAAPTAVSDEGLLAALEPLLSPGPSTPPST
jgi:AcrR family transcriptional regulator